MKKSIPDQQQDFELIGRFHDFELTEAELQSFEERMENDPVFQERFRLYGEMDKHIDRTIAGAEKDQVVADFKSELQPERKNMPTKIRSLFSRPVLRVAATIALLLVAGFWWLLRPEVLDSSVALADYYWENTEKAHLFDGNQRGEDTHDPNEPARTFFRTIRGYQKNGQYSTMVDQLEIYKITTPAPIPFEDDADWLLAIAYLANNDLENAKIQLANIIKGYPARKAKAQQLLDDIEKLETVGKVKR